MIDQAVDELIATLAGAAEADYIGEPISQLAHALQAAALAKQARAADDEVIAALLHDIGHLVAPADHPNRSNVGVVDHAAVGSDYLRSLGFSSYVCDLVRAHVDAKRYLVATNPDHASTLSTASVRSLELQGGMMTDAEVARFDRLPWRDAALRIRSWDEGAKDPSADVSSELNYRYLLVAHLKAVGT